MDFDPIDLQRMAVTLSMCSFPVGTFQMGDHEEIRKTLLGALVAKDASGAPDPHGDRWLYASFIEMMSGRELHALLGSMNRLPRFRSA